MIISLMGPPGSGKGTYAQLLAKQGWVHFSMGQALRNHVEQKGKYASKVNEMTKKGHLVSNTIAYYILKEELRSLKGKKIVLDGFPRNIEQTKGVRKIFHSIKQDISAFVYIDVSEEETFRRLTGRTQCKKCGRIYGASMHPKKKGSCDVDNGKLIRRKDDAPSVIRERFRVYRTKTYPLLDWAARHYLVFHLNGHGSPRVVFKRVLNVISLIK
ncbi:MAG: nucleoside monophosphate kinase [Candidatus Diapherotrites archaeon]